MEPHEYDFSGLVTKFDVKCSDGRVITHGAFSHQIGQRVPLVWNHIHDDPSAVLGYVDLKDHPDGLMGFGKFNNTEQGKNCKELVVHGDVFGMSICANRLKHTGSNVMHGKIIEVSLVMASANPGAYIDTIMAHGEEEGDEAIIFSGEPLVLSHSDVKEEPKMDDEAKNTSESSEEEEKKDRTVQDVIDGMDTEEKLAMAYMIEQALLSKESENSEEDEEMKHNAFENDAPETGTTLCHSDEVAILTLAKSSGCGNLQDAIATFMDENEQLAHSYGNDVAELFPVHKDVKSGAPELIERDKSWVAKVMNGVKRSPIPRIRTRQFNATGEDLVALGYKKGDKKALTGALKLLKRTTDPTTVYVRDDLHRDDILDIEDFDAVEFNWGVMDSILRETLATAVLISDGRPDSDDHKIDEEKIRPIWQDDELYTIHADVDFAAAKAELQGTDTAAHFGDNYIKAEAMITANLYAREKYKGSGNLIFFCDPHVVNQMLLARDLNGRRIYESKADLAAALNVDAIETVEQMAGKTRTYEDPQTHKVITKKLLALLVNLNDYQIGAVKNGKITRFQNFNIDFNKEQMLEETRCSGALIKVKSAIALEEDVTPASQAG